MPRLASTNLGVGIRNPLFDHFDQVLTSVPPQGDLDRNLTQVLPIRLQIFNRKQSIERNFVKVVFSRATDSRFSHCLGSRSVLYQAHIFI